MEREIRRGFIIEVIGTAYNGMKGYVTITDFHSATVELSDGSTHDLLKENLKIINGDTEIEYGEDDTLRQVKERYIKSYLGYPEKYLQTWTEEDIRKVLDRFNGIDLSLKNKRQIAIVDYELAAELQRTIGGVQWLRRRLFQKESNKVSLTDLIKKLKDEFGLI